VLELHPAGDRFELDGAAVGGVQGGGGGPLRAGELGQAQPGSSWRAAAVPARNPCTLASRGTPGRRAEGTAASSALLPSSSALAKRRKLCQAASTSGSGARRRGHIAPSTSSTRISNGMP
jgi:hypothetical protein